MIRDASLSQADLAFFRRRDSAFDPLGEYCRPPHQNTTAYEVYEVYLDRLYTDGRVFLRTKDGRVACYDLTKPGS